mmetsp:Transcript_17563/g.41668  ORF Transcript_17563/g.41668 Transcript_17563/m.41668 type:complete len:101 (-) Transcript_17563:6-308(-)
MVKAYGAVDELVHSAGNDVIHDVGAGAIGGHTFTKGVYKWDSIVSMMESITLKGSATDVFIFSVASYFSTAAGVRSSWRARFGAYPIIYIWEIKNYIGCP